MPEPSWITEPILFVVECVHAVFFFTKFKTQFFVTKLAQKWSPLKSRCSAHFSECIFVQLRGHLCFLCEVNCFWSGSPPNDCPNRQTHCSPQKERSGAGPLPRSRLALTQALALPASWPSPTRRPSPGRPTLGLRRIRARPVLSRRDSDRAPTALPSHEGTHGQG